MLQFLSLKYTKAYSISHPLNAIAHTTQHIMYCTSHSTGEVSRVALNSSFSPVCSSTESSGSGPSHDQATVNSSVSELEDPEADDQVISLLSKLRAPRPSSLASHTLSGSGLRPSDLSKHAHMAVKFTGYSSFMPYAFTYRYAGNYAGIIDASLAGYVLFSSQLCTFI